MRRDSVKGHLSALLACIIWGLTFVHTKILIHYFDGMTIIFLRYMIAASIIFAYISYSGCWKKVKRKDILLLLITGLLGMFGYNILLTWSLYTITPSVSSVFNGTIPIFTMIADFLLVRKQGLSRRLMLAGICSLLGIFLVAVGDGLSLSGHAWIGCSLMMIATFCWIIYTFVSEKLFAEYGQLQVIGCQMLAACLITFPSILNAGLNLNGLLSVEVLPHVLSLGILCSMTAFVLFSIGILNIGQSSASLYLNIVPITSVIAAFIMIGDPISPLKIIGILIVIASLRIGSSGDEHAMKSV